MENRINNLDARESELLQRIKNDSRVEFLAELSGKRVVVRIPVDLIATREECNIRHKSPEDVGVLKTSIQQTTGGDTLYSIAMLADGSAEELDYVIGDGHQRLRALKEAKATSTDAMVILHWRDIRDAKEGSASGNFARYPLSDADVFLLMRDPYFDDDRIKRLSGFQESKVRRLRLVANHEWMAILVTEEALGYSKAASLIQACDSKPDRLAALEHTLMQLKAKADAGVKEYKAKAKTSNIGKKGRDKTQLDWWFRQMNEELEAAKAKIETGDVEKIDGQWQVRTEGTAQQLVATIGTDLEWKSVLAVENFFGRKISEVPLVSFDEVLAQWETIGQKVREARGVVALLQSTPKPTTAMASIAEPEEQHPPLGVDNN